MLSRPVLRGAGLVNATLQHESLNVPLAHNFEQIKASHIANPCLCYLRVHIHTRISYLLHHVSTVNVFRWVRARIHFYAKWDKSNCLHLTESHRLKRPFVFNWLTWNLWLAMYFGRSTPEDSCRSWIPSGLSWKPPHQPCLKKGKNKNQFKIHETGATHKFRHLSRTFSSSFSFLLHFQ